MAATHNSAIPIEGGDNSQPEDPDALLQDSPEEGAEAGDEANPEDGDDTGMTDSSIDPREGLDGMLHDMEAQNEGVTSPEESKKLHPYKHLREISALASWTVSSHKPGCGVPALRDPSLSLFWQSDGPQPHTVSVHFIKRVFICHMRINIDWLQDESYTPTRLHVWAGTGHHDLCFVCEKELVRPKGWVDLDLTNAGGKSEFEEDEGLSDYSDLNSEDEAVRTGDSERAWQEKLASMRRGLRRSHEENDAYLRKKLERKAIREAGRGPTLRCFLVQIRIMENFQNGKDTHLRGLQIFTKDEAATAGWRRRHGRGADDLGASFGRLPKEAAPRSAPSQSGSSTGKRKGKAKVAPTPPKRGRPMTRLSRGGIDAARQELREALQQAESSSGNSGGEKAEAGLEESHWMKEPELR